MCVSPHEGRVPGRRSRFPITRPQNSRRQTYWRISVGVNVLMIRITLDIDQMLYKFSDSWN